MDRFGRLKKEFEEIENKMKSPESLASQARIQEFAKRHAKLAPIVSKLKELEDAEREIRNLESVLEGPDKDLWPIAQEEKGELEKRVARLEGDIRIALLPENPNDSKNVFLEVRAGAGGEEAALFAADLVRMYTRYAQSRNCRVELVDLSSTGLKGTRQATLFVRGEKVYSWLKFEGGVHRVQRVPRTESSGRIHTSTCTVAVLPEREEVEVQIDPGDLRVDTFRASGHGGQHLQKTESAVRITHIPTGIVVTCQNERSQLQNREKAMRVLRAKIAVRAEEARARDVARTRKSQVGTGERSEKIRTYNFAQNRVTDHRIGQSWHNLDVVLDGALEPVIETLRRHEVDELLKRGRDDPFEP